jgi:hypothetical protein
MKNKNLKKLALLGITGGMMISAESGVVAAESTVSFPVHLAAGCGSGSCGGKQSSCHSAPGSCKSTGSSCKSAGSSCKGTTGSRMGGETAARDLNLGTTYDRTYWEKGTANDQRAQSAYGNNQSYQYQDPGMASGGPGTGTMTPSNLSTPNSSTNYGGSSYNSTSGTYQGASGSQVTPGYGGSRQNSYGTPGYSGTQGGYKNYGNQNPAGTEGGYGSSYYSPGTPSSTSTSSQINSYDSSGTGKTAPSGSLFNSTSQQSNATKRAQMSK